MQPVDEQQNQLLTAIRDSNQSPDSPESQLALISVSKQFIQVSHSGQAPCNPEHLCAHVTSLPFISFCRLCYACQLNWWGGHVCLIGRVLSSDTCSVPPPPPPPPPCIDIIFETFCVKLTFRLDYHWGTRPWLRTPTNASDVTRISAVSSVPQSGTETSPFDCLRDLRAFCVRSRRPSWWPMPKPPCPPSATRSRLRSWPTSPSRLRFRSASCGTPLTRCVPAQ